MQQGPFCRMSVYSLSGSAQGNLVVSRSSLRDERRRAKLAASCVGVGMGAVQLNVCIYIYIYIHRERDRERDK